MRADAGIFKPRRARCEATGWGASRFDPRRLAGFPRAVKLSRMRPLQGTNIPSTVTPISAVAARRQKVWTVARLHPELAL